MVLQRSINGKWGSGDRMMVQMAVVARREMLRKVFKAWLGVYMVKRLKAMEATGAMTMIADAIAGFHAAE